MTIPTKKFHGHVFERDYQHLPGRRETFERFDDVSHQVMWLDEDINKWRASKHHGHGSAVESATLKENEGVGSDVGRNAENAGNRAELLRGSVRSRSFPARACRVKPNHIIVQIFCFRDHSSPFRELLMNDLALTRAHFLKHSALTTTNHEQDAVLPFAVRRRGLQEPDVLHARRRPRQRRQDNLKRLQPLPTALRRRRSAHSRAPQARIDARRDARDFQPHGHVALLPQAAARCARRCMPAVANTTLRHTRAPTNTTTTSLTVKGV